jgi:hypothetical protein
MHGLVSALRDIDFSSIALSELEQGVVTCIRRLKKQWEAHNDSESLARGIQIGGLVLELSRHHEGNGAIDFSSVLFPVLNT